MLSKAVCTSFRSSNAFAVTSCRVASSGAGALAGTLATLTERPRLTMLRQRVRAAKAAQAANSTLACSIPATSRHTYRPMSETERTYLNPGHFFALMRSHGTSFFSGVPDSLLKDLCAFITERVPKEDHVISANEGTALATAAGHYLATQNIPCVYLQNSGLGNLVNPLLSLCSNKVYSIPVLLLIGWRGEPGAKDEPQHLVQGKITPNLLSEMGIAHDILPDHSDGAFEVLNKAYAYMRKEKSPFALLVKKATFEKFNLASDQGAFSEPNMLHREEILEEIITSFPDEPLVTTTGFTSREVFELRKARGESHEKDFLTVSAWGIALRSRWVSRCRSPSPR
jgi:phosphonopyruvate decarboxylase